MADLGQSCNPEELLASIIQLKAQAKDIDEQLSAALDKLSALADEAEIDQNFRYDDWAFSWQSRKSYSYPQEVTEIEAILKTAKRTAEADGSATAKLGAPFWTIRSPKP